MAEIEFGVYDQEQQGQRRRLSLSSSSSAELYHIPQRQPQNGYLIADQSIVTQTSLQNYGISQQKQQQQLPEQQLSLQELNPFPASVFSYTIFLVSSLAVWVVYLLLPRGVRKQYFRANRKRYARRLDDNMPAAGYWMSVQAVKAQSTSTTPGFESASTVGSNHHQYTSSIIAAAAARQKKQTRGGGIPMSIQTAQGGRPYEGNTSSLQIPSSPPRSRPAALKTPPSPEHPALKKIPPNKIIAETMARLQGRGIRLVAHGVHCDPKRVWIRLQEEEGVGGTVGEPSVTWQTEFPRRVPDQNGNVSIVLMRGSLHSISLKNILYIDVGKKTHALQLARGVPDNMCLSLLTQNGSLDLQANSKLERDSLVSCFSMILDDIHEEDWRALYEASPEPSLANSSTVFGGGSFGNPPSFHLDARTTPGSNATLLTPSPHTSSNKDAPTEKDRMLQLL